MPDYAACSQLTCERRSTCARYLMAPTQRHQWYSEFDPQNCQDYWDVTEGVPFKLLPVTEVDKVYGNWKRNAVDDGQEPRP